MTTEASTETLSVRAADLAAAVAGAPVLSIDRVGGGLANPLFRVTFGDRHPPLAARFVARGDEMARREAAVLASLAGRAPAPRLRQVAHGGAPPLPCLIYEWVDGVTVDRALAAASPADAGAIAREVGRALAAAGACADAPAPRRPASLQLDGARAALRSPAVRDRLGEAQASGLATLLADADGPLRALDARPSLVHGDFGGRNIVVRQSDEGAWTVTAILDWEWAALGTALWDIGAFLREPARATPALRDAFADGFTSAAGPLPPDWWWLARVLDATRLVAIAAAPAPSDAAITEARDILSRVVPGLTR